ncbi:MAG: FHA domain-containing protein [Chloroflexota bacterium]|nr:FHA domain-containing protein [Chloroflexota bacterium]
MSFIGNKRAKKKYQGKHHFPGISHILILLFALLILINTTQQGYAQWDQPLLIQSPDTSLFPTITLPFKLPISQNELNADLKTDQIRVYEDGTSYKPESLEKGRSGVHFTLVLNPGRQLDLRDEDGVSPYEKLRDALVDWSQTRSSFSGDRWSLVSDAGVEISSSSDRTLWVSALKAYQPDFRMLEPDLSSLETAVDLASERVVPFGVDKALLYITPAPSATQIEAIQALSRDAQSAGIQVNVWLVDDAYFLTNEQGGALINLAKNTGGNFFNFTGTEDFPNPEAYLTNLGYYFKLTYQSGIRETGTTPLRIVITTPSGEISGESSPLYIEIKPPNPILVSPPAIIRRTQLEGAGDELSPATQSIEIMMEFPDSHPRPLVLSRLYVDGKVVDERDTPPFDVLEWDLTSLTDRGEHSIQVEVEDSLGFSAKTIITPVQVEVILPEPEEGLGSRQVEIFLLGFVLLISLAILISWLIRRYWQTDRVKRFIPTKLREESSAGIDVSQMAEEKGRIVAGLFPLENCPGNTEGMHSFSRSRVYIGRDAKKADLIIDDKSIDDAHALLHHDETNFWLNDLGTNCGTWVNYRRISRQPVQIQAGDIIHFGNCGFRFTIIDANTPQVTVSKYEPAL